ncbi:hypothetical protein JXB41_05645 [Candidatus Woesearchaeota archaeon]|nr:hypothetical protein [Candidatus Woesearchaeota archaeon]
MGKTKNHLINLSVLLVTSLFCLIIVEIFARYYLPDTPYHNNNPFNKYGWNQNENEIFIKSIQDTKNNTRKITARVYNNGFKRWGNVSTEKLRMLIIGDSFTEMFFVNNSEEWYSYLERAFPEIEFFVHGTQGYGTLQEYLILDDFFDSIQPNFILWQFHPNDYTNNYRPLEVEDLMNNNNLVRPYYQEGKIYYEHPSRFTGIRKVSKILDYFLSKKHTNILKKYREGNSNPVFMDIEIKKRQKSYEEKAKIVTIQIFDKAKKRAKNSSIFLFSTHPMSENELKLCSKTNITCIEGVGELVEDKIKRGEELIAHNEGHWNYRGNKVVGEFLAEYFKKELALND